MNYSPASCFLFVRGFHTSSRHLNISVESSLMQYTSQMNANDTGAVWDIGTSGQKSELMAILAHLGQNGQNHQNQWISATLLVGSSKFEIDIWHWNCQFKQKRPGFSMFFIFPQILLKYPRHVSEHKQFGTTGASCWRASIHNLRGVAEAFQQVEGRILTTGTCELVN